MNDRETNFALLAIVGIVAIVALVILLKSNTTPISGYDNAQEKNVAGQMMRGDADGDCDIACKGEGDSCSVGDSCPKCCNSCMRGTCS